MNPHRLPSKTQTSKKSFLFSDHTISSLSDACGGGGVRYKTSKSHEKTVSPIPAILSAIAVTVLFMFLIFSFVKNAELAAEISSMKSDLGKLISEKQTLEGQLDYKYSKFEIEDTLSALGYGTGKNSTVYLED